jgi:ribosomal protein S18 acetylase RimI-like enzyme
MEVTLIPADGSDKMQDALLVFLESIDADFDPPLSHKVVLSDFVKKVMDLGEVIFAIDTQGRLVGSAGLYANDRLIRQAYLNYLGIAQECRGHGVGRMLVSEVLQIAKNRGMQSIQLHVNPNNKGAIHLYQNFGFEFVEKDAGPNPGHPMILDLKQV